MWLRLEMRSDPDLHILRELVAASGAHFRE